METGGLQGPIRFHVVPLDNRTLLATLVGRNATSLQSALLGRRGGGYDGQGALSYVVVVLCIYAFSIILMIGSVIKKSKHDNAVNRYMKGMDQIRRMERREQKFKIRLEVLGRANSERTVSRVKLSQSRSLPKRGRHQLGRGSPDSRTQMDPEWSQGPRVQEDAEWAKIPLVPPEGLVFDPETQGRDVTAESRSHEWGGGETVRVPGLQIQFQEDWTQGSETQSEQHQWNQFEMMELSASRDSLPGSGNACHVPLHVAETNMASGDLGSLRPALNDASPVDAFSVNLEGAPLLSPGGVSPGGTLVRMDTLPEVDEDVISV